MKILFLLISFLFLIYENLSFAQVDKTSDFDQKLYYPQDQSLRDLFLEAEIVGLSDLIKQRLDNAKIQKVVFKIYWLFPGKIAIEVDGIKGFEELKTELKMMIAEKLDYLVPEKIGQKFRSYNLKKEGEKILLLDETGDKLVSKVEIELDEKDIIHIVKVIGAGVNNKITYKSSMKRWGNNKFSFDQVVLENNQMGRKSKRTDNISYGVVQGYGFPSEIETIQELEIENSKEKIPNSTIKYLFKNYKVNEGEALKYFNSKK